MIFCGIISFLLNYIHTTHNAEYLNLLIGLNVWSLNFLFISFLIFFIKIWKNSNKKIVIAILIVTLKSSLYKYTGTKPILIQALWVGTINIHPILLYTSIICIFFYLFSTCTGYFLQKLLFSNMNILLLSCLALVLGGFWGTQSLTWGYFWVNDIIEWSLLFLCFFLVYIKHKVQNLYISYFYLSNLCLLFTTLIFIRLNFISTRHSFFSSFNLTLYIIYFFIFFPLWVLSYYCDKKKINKVCHLTSYLILFYSGILSISNFVFVVKYTFFKYYDYYLTSNKIFNKKISNFLIHFIIILFCLCWSPMFINFFLNLYQDISYFLKMSIHLKTTIHNQNSFISIKNFYNQLEIITFNINLNSSIYLTFLDKFTYESSFNMFVIYVLFMFFILLLF